MTSRLCARVYEVLHPHFLSDFVSTPDRPIPGLTTLGPTGLGLGLEHTKLAPTSGLCHCCRSPWSSLPLMDSFSCVRPQSRVTSTEKESWTTLSTASPTPTTDRPSILLISYFIVFTANLVEGKVESHPEPEDHPEPSLTWPHQGSSPPVSSGNLQSHSLLTSPPDALLVPLRKATKTLELSNIYLSQATWMMPRKHKTWAFYFHVCQTQWPKAGQRSQEGEG